MSTVPNFVANKKRKIKKILSFFLIFLFFAVNFSGDAPFKISTARADAFWYDPNWSDRFKITPDSVNSDLYFPLANAPTDFWTNVRSDGGDIRVTTQDGVTEVPREVSGFDYAGHAGSLFIGTSGGTAFYIYYGNSAATEPAAGSAYGKYNVSESAKKVFAHLEEVTNPLKDSTSNANDLTASGSYSLAQTGRVNKCAHLTGVQGGALGMAEPANSVLSTDIYTVAFSVKIDVLGNPGYVFSRGGIGDIDRYDSIGTYTGRWLIFNGVDLVFGGTPQIDTWYRVVFQRNNTAVRLIVNNSVVIDWITVPIRYVSGKIAIGERIGPSWPEQGYYDELSVWDNRLLSDAEIATDYANQNDPASFWTTEGQQLSNDNKSVTITGTVNPVITMNVGALASATPCDGTFTGNGGTVALGTLSTAAVASSDANSVPHICVRISANPYYGLVGLVTSANGSLKSTGTPGDAIPSGTAALTPGTTGYGLCIAAPSGADAGSDTWAGDSPYASGSCSSTLHSVGQVQTTPQQLLHADGPVQNMYMTGYIKAAVAGTVKAHTDYADTLTFVISGTF